jgi:phosphoserine/homoserine phosphotransferase
MQVLRIRVHPCPSVVELISLCSSSHRGKQRRTRQAKEFLEHFAPVKQSIVTLDLEGVLVPEIWIAVAEKTGIKELRSTTRDEPDYDKLMRARLTILDQHRLKLSDIQQVISTLRPLKGGKEFLDELRSNTQVIILSDTFEQFAKPLMQQLGWPALLCHRLVVENDRITDYQIRIPEQKQKAVAALKLLNYHVISAGDSFNDTAMLAEADAGFLFHAPENIKAQFPQFKAVDDYGELLKLIQQAMK